MTTKDIKVSIVCDVYNHEPYLRDCFEGFVNQKVNFKYEILVNDDASTDNSAKIIKEYEEKYPELFKVIYQKENQYSQGIKIWGDIQFPRANGQYVAVCEGDDYWTDMSKLQKQVDILDCDNSLMGVVTNSSVVNFNGELIKPMQENVVQNNVEGKYDLRDFLTPPQHSYPTATVMFRNNPKNEILQKLSHTRNKYLSDWTLWIILLSYGNFYYLDEVTAAYRINPTSVTHTCDRVGRAKASRQICNAVADILPAEYSDIAKEFRDTRWTWISLFFAYRYEKKYIKMFGSLFMALILCPGAMKTHISNYLHKTK